MSVPPSIETLAAKLGLSSFEKNILLLCTGMELDAGFRDLIKSVQGSDHFMSPTFGLALAVLPDAHWSAVSPDGPLRYWRLIEISKSPLLTNSPINIDESILHYLTGLNGFNERLKDIIEPSVLVSDLVPSQRHLSELILQALVQKMKDNIPPLVHLYGSDWSDKIAIAAYVSAALHTTLFTVSAYALPAGNREVLELARLWSREAKMHGYVLLLDCSHIELQDKARLQALISFIENVQGAIIFNGDIWTPELKRSKVVFDITKPNSSEQILLWQTVLGNKYETEKDGLEKIASQFNLSADTIRKVGFETIAKFSLNGKKNENGSEEFGKKLWKVCCQHTRPQVDELAQRLEHIAHWDDIVLPGLQINTLKEIAAQVKHRNKVYSEWGFANKGTRGLGISALFAGESGTGKTMASEVLANELDLDLYKIDLSKVVNKYIGETEKNLKKIFDAADRGGAILLFDEADALFGKRSEVKDSHDRYSNIEVSYLLQRMEAYRGLAILTTNMKNALDKAFLRRIRFVIHFPFPDMMQRAEIWSKVFPANTPKGNLDLERLARLTIPGGSIRNIALNAAFYAADENKAVQMSHIFRAAKSEYDKMEKPFNTVEMKAWQ